ncbi:MAG: alginate O-acetyltransferase AlgX-related protein, partial [Candidatus Sumerlaeota bacterium]
MRIPFPAIAIFMFLFITSLFAREAESKKAEAFRQVIKEQTELAVRKNLNALQGEDGWFFFVPELQNLLAGPFWGEAAANVSRASAPAADPMPAILKVKEDLDKIGIHLILVPVPPKAAVYPDKISKNI